jgi:hypothetical protein
VLFAVPADEVLDLNRSVTRLTAFLNSLCMADNNPALRRPMTMT